MGRRLSTGLILIRVGVLLASFVPGAMNGWLLYYLHANKLGPSDLMLVLELLVGLGHTLPLLHQPRSNLFILVPSFVARSALLYLTPTTRSPQYSYTAYVAF